MNNLDVEQRNNPTTQTKSESGGASTAWRIFEIWHLHVFVEKLDVKFVLFFFTMGLSQDLTC